MYVVTVADPRARQGFTLLEVLFVITISVIMIVFVMIASVIYVRSTRQEVRG